MRRLLPCYRSTERTLEELRRLDAGSRFDPAYAGERIPSFRQVLCWATKLKVVLLLDLKESGRDFAEQVAAEVRDYGIEENMVVGVRSIRQAAHFRELLPRALQLAFMGSADEIEAYTEAGVDVIRLWLRWLEQDSGLADQVRQTGKKLMINGTMGEPEEARAIMSYSPDWILINDPARLMRSLDQIGVSSR